MPDLIMDAREGPAPPTSAIAEPSLAASCAAGLISRPLLSRTTTMPRTKRWPGRRGTTTSQREEPADNEAQDDATNDEDEEPASLDDSHTTAGPVNRSSRPHNDSRLAHHHIMRPAPDDITLLPPGDADLSLARPHLPQHHAERT